jgi:hypothetical protein
MSAIKAGHVCDMSASESKLRLHLRLLRSRFMTPPLDSISATGPESYCSGPRPSAPYLLARLTSESSGSAVVGPPGRCSPTVCNLDCTD